MTICQFKNLTKHTLLTIFLFGCASAPVSDSKRDDRVIRAEYNKLPLRFAHRNDDDSYVVNPFFDIDPRIENFKEKSPDANGIRYFVSTPVDSKFQYEFDLYSGKLYRERELCPQDDVWDNYSADIVSPNFTQGIIPRTYDQNRDPMKIIMISDKEFIEPFKENPTHYDEARIIGSMVIDHCENFPCDLKSKWKSSQILVGVSTRDPDFNATDSFTDLKKRINWDYARAYLTNVYGYHRIGGKIYPAYRISKELNLKDSLIYFKQNSQSLSAENMVALNKWRGDCMKLYDNLWDEEEKARKMSYGGADKFFTDFKNMYAKDSETFYQCSKLVRPANIIEDHRRLWFFAYLQAFTFLEKNSFYFSCQDKAWAYNARVDETHLFVDQNKELNKCSAKNFEKAFDQAINGMSLMKNQLSRQYRFVEYDNMRGGSHQKIYGWIQNKGHNIVCKYDKKKEPKQIPFDIFPQDVVWENFKQDEDRLVK